MENENRIVESANETKEEVMANLGLSNPDEKKAEKSDSAQAEETTKDSEALETDEDGEEVTEDDGSKEEQAKGKKQGGFQKKINKLTGRALTAEQERDYWKAEALKQSQSSAPKKEETQTSQSENSGKPDPSTFDTHTEYLDALTDWKIDQRDKKVAEEKQKETALTEAQKQAQAFQTKVEEFVKVKSDYHEVLNNCDVVVKQGLIDLIKESEIAPLLGYELASNEEELERINALPPRQAAIELLKFEAKLLSSSEKTTEKKEVKTTQAARPLKPVGSASKANLNDSPYEKEMTYAEFKEWSAKQKR